jgi:hypothetical protein
VGETNAASEIHCTGIEHGPSTHRRLVRRPFIKIRVVAFDIMSEVFCLVVVSFRV